MTLPPSVPAQNPAQRDTENVGQTLSTSNPGISWWRRSDLAVTLERLRCVRLAISAGGITAAKGRIFLNGINAKGEILQS
jgi:hypothetical protein